MKNSLACAVAMCLTSLTAAAATPEIRLDSATTVGVQNQLRVGSSMTSSSSSRMAQNVDLSTTGSGTSIGQNGADKRHKA